MAEQKRDYYEVLGISKTADDAEIKKAYRVLAKKYHPDMNPGDAEAEKKFKEASEAYAVLSDPEKRRQYDQFGHAAFEGGGAGGFGGFDFNSADFSDSFGYIFGDMFGGGRRRASNGPMKGANIRTSVRITFEEAVFGVEQLVRSQKLPAESRFVDALPVVPGRELVRPQTLCHAHPPPLYVLRSSAQCCGWYRRQAESRRCSCASKHLHRTGSRSGRTPAAAHGWRIRSGRPIPPMDEQVQIVAGGFSGAVHILSLIHI